MHDLTGFQRDLLYAVAGDDGASGLDLKADLEAYGYREVHHGRLYPNLDALAENGLVSKGKQDGRTNAYRLTSRGERMIRERREWEYEQIREVVSA